MTTFIIMTCHFQQWRRNTWILMWMSAGLHVTFMGRHISVSSSITYWSVSTACHHLTSTVPPLGSMSSLLATWLMTHWWLCKYVYICVCISLLFNSQSPNIVTPSFPEIRDPLLPPLANRDLQPCFWPQVMHLQRAAVGREALCPMHPSSIHGVEDMSTLAELHEAAIMHNLFLRYQKDNIYVSRIPEEILILLQTKMSC